MSLTAQHVHTVMEQLHLEERVFVLGMADVLFHVRSKTYISGYRAHTGILYMVVKYCK